jgi:hypothetical protein
MHFICTPMWTNFFILVKSGCYGSLGACFGYRWDDCERWSFVATGVTPVSLRPLITVGNLGARSCLDIV